MILTRARDARSSSSDLVWRSCILQLQIAVVLVLLLSVRAYASELEFKPIPVQLWPSAPTELITVSNRGSDPTRIQVSVFTWDQDPNGEMKNNPTDDLVFFPPLVEVGAGQDQIVRIGTAAPFGATEKAYRIVVEELPVKQPPVTVGGRTVAPKLIIAQKVSLPLFLEPSNIVTGHRLEDPKLIGSKLTFRVRNTGNTRLTVDPRYSAVGPDGAAVPAAPVQGGTVLAGGVRDFNATIPNPTCRQISKLKIDVNLKFTGGGYDSKYEKESAELTPGANACSR